MTWTGKALAEDLAKVKESNGWMVWIQLPLGSVWLGCARADVMAIKKSFTNPTCIIYEVKVSRGDFHADVNEGKYRKYLDDCAQFFFAVPSGIIHAHEVPQETGLIVRGDKGWHVVKSAPRREHTFRVEMLLKLLMKGYERQTDEWKQHDKLVGLEYKGLKDVAQKHGIKIATDLLNATDIIQEAEKLVKEIGKITGKQYGTLHSALWGIEHDIRARLGKRKYMVEAIELAGVVDDLLNNRVYDSGAISLKLSMVADKVKARLDKDAQSEKKEGG